MPVQALNLLLATFSIWKVSQPTNSTVLPSMGSNPNKFVVWFSPTLVGISSATFKHKAQSGRYAAVFSTYWMEMILLHTFAGERTRTCQWPWQWKLKFSCEGPQSQFKVLASITSAWCLKNKNLLYCILLWLIAWTFFLVALVLCFANEWTWLPGMAFY